MPLHDATDYQFATPTRRLLVRQARAADAGVNLHETARRHAEQLTSLLDATDIHVSSPAGTTVTVTATLPPDAAAADRTPRSVRTAFVRFSDSLFVEITLHAPATDTGAEAEFGRLLGSVRPAAAADPLDGVALALAAGPTGRPGHPVGAVRIDLTPDYHGPATFVVESADNAVRYQLERAEAFAAATRSAGIGAILGSGVAAALSEEGRPVRYETGSRPRLSPLRQAGAAATAESAPAVRGVGGTAPAAPGGAIISGAVHGTPVQIRVTARDERPDARELGEQLLRTLNGRR